MEVIQFSNKEQEYERVLAFLQIVEAEYYPPLSERCSLEEWIDQAVEKGNILYLEERDKIAGMITYFYHEAKFDAAYIDTVSVLPEFRGRGLGQLLIEECFADLEAKKIKKVKVRTWSTNKVSTHLYLKLGFRVYETVKDDRGPGIDSVYFEKNM